MLKVLSLGAGVQSSTILLMSCYGELERIDAAIFADVGWEPRKVYQWLEFLKGEAARAGIPVYVVRNGNIRDDAMNAQVKGDKKGGGKRWASMPYFTANRETGALGMIRRQCTDNYKVRPIERKIREIVGYKPKQRIPVGTVETWKGISTDEIRRATISQRRWISFYYPLIDLGMSRNDCLGWFASKSLPLPPRSSCLGCPYHSNKEWREIKQRPDEWNDVVTFDMAIRKCGGMRGDVFLHRSCVPLDEVDLRSAEDRGQLTLFGGDFREECAGVCGV